MTSQPGPDAAREKFDEVTLHKVFSPVTRLELKFGVLQGHACAKNLPWVGGEVCAKFGGD